MRSGHLKVLGRQACQVLDQLCEGVAHGESRRVDNTQGTFMPVSIEHLSVTPIGSIFSVAHYFEQNGDLIADPDMTFLRAMGGTWSALSYQDSSGYRRGAEVTAEGRVRIWPREHAAQTRFGAIWMRNIRGQQGLR